MEKKSKAELEAKFAPTELFGEDAVTLNISAEAHQQMCHHLKNALVSVVNFTQLCIDKPDDPRVQEWIKRLHQKGLDMVDYVDYAETLIKKDMPNEAKEK